MKPKNNKGLIITSLLFVTLMSFIGISLLASTIFHVRILGARDKKNRDSRFLHSSLIKYLHNFREEIYNTDLNKFELIENDFFNKENFPDQIESTYLVSNYFNNRIKYADKYRSINIFDIVTASIKNKLKLESTVNIDILSGNIPISRIPFYLNKKPEIPKDSFLKNKKINISSENVLTQIDTRVKFELSNFLKDSLGLKGKTLNWKEIRDKAGVEINDYPLENGVYTFVGTETEDELEAIFIQGDVQKITFSIEDQKQRILISHEDKDYLIEYKPSEYAMKYWGNDFEESVLFKEKIIINGNIHSVLSEGDFAFLNNTNLSLYSSGIVYIDSSLDSDSSAGSNLKIITGYNEFFNKPSDGGRIIINKTADNSTLKLSVSLFASGKVINNSKDTIIKGSMYLNDIENKGKISISPSLRNNSSDTFFTTEKFTFIKEFTVSFSGEVYSE